MKKRILIVDDNSTNIYLLKSILEGEGLEVAAAQNGREALERAHADPPDLIITDILMPVMDGYALCRQWKSDDTLKHIPLVFYTATYTESKDEDFSLSLGADRFILKPLEPDALMTVLSEMLDENYVARQVATKPLEEEMQFFRQYNEILFGKLEKNMLDLETTNEKLRQLEERYRLSIENVTDVIYIIDVDLNIISMSPSIEKILGYKPQDFIGRPVTALEKIFTPESYQQAVANTIQVLNGGIIRMPVYRFIAKDGTIKYGEVSGSHVMREGKIIGIIAAARDITERKKAEETLQETQDLLNEVGRIAGIGGWKMDLNSGKATWTQGTYDIVEIEPGQPIPGPDEHVGYYLPGYRPLIVEAMRALIEDGKPLDFEAQLRTAKGNVKWCRALGKAVHEDGKTIGVYGTLQDITERKRAEEALENEHSLLRSLIDNVPDRIYAKDRESRFIVCNEAMVHRMGKASMADIIGKSDFDLLPQEMAQRFYDDEREVVQSGKPIINREEPLKIAGGKITRWNLATKVPLRDKNGNTIGIVGVGREITDLKQAEEALQESEACYRSVFENHAAVKLLIDPDNGTILEANKAAVKYYGWSAEQFKRMNIEEINTSPPDEVRKARERVRGEKQVHFEFRHRLADGSIRDVEVFSSFIEVRGKGILHAIVHDITRRKQAQEELEKTKDQLLQSEKLASMGRLSAGVAHEILNPVNIISMELQMLKIMENLPPGVPEELEICMAQIKRIVDITEDLKQLSRVPVKKTVMANINETIANVMSLFTTQLQIEGIETEVQYEPDLPAIAMDKAKIEQVIINLISNAAAAMEGKAKKALRVRTERETVSGGHDQVKITFADTGTGIQREHLSKIFDPFFTTKGQGKGTGLGLSISYGIVRDHGGTILAVNNEWGGASFCIRLPIKADTGNTHG